MVQLHSETWLALKPNALLSLCSLLKYALKMLGFMSTLINRLSYLLVFFTHKFIW